MRHYGISSRLITLVILFFTSTCLLLHVSAIEMTPTDTIEDRYIPPAVHQAAELQAVFVFRDEGL